MTSINTIKQNILTLIQNDNYDVTDVLAILTDVSNYINDPTFVTNINQIATILTADRDGSNTFTMNDITMLSKDPTALLSLATLLISTLYAIPNLKIQYVEGASELLVFELLAYIILIVIPKQAKLKWSYDEKAQVVNIVAIIATQLQNSQMIQQLFEDATKWFKSNVNCQCFKPTTDNKQAVFNSKLSYHSLIINHSIDLNREKTSMMNELSKLKNTLKNSDVKEKRNSVKITTIDGTA